MQPKPEAVEDGQRLVVDKVLSQQADFDVKKTKSKESKGSEAETLITEELAQNLQKIEVKSIIDQ